MTRPNAIDFNALCRAEGAYVVRALRYFGVPERDLPDVAQDVLLVVHRKLPEFEQRSSVRTWLYRIAQRSASDYRRKAHVRKERMVTDDPSAERSDGHDAAQRLEARAELLRALEQLDDDKRTVFVLYEIEGLDMKQVAEVLECPLQTAYSRLHAARALMVQTLTAEQRGVA
jgi:RNA polymerase sigma-70 factor (ECF subfamily)